jgi:hypothetical protein
MLKLKDYLYSLALFLVACSNTPNNVSINLNQGVCAQSNQYSTGALSSLQTNYSNYYNLLVGNPTTITPFCMSITVQNNNSGNNANNIQITNNGLQVSNTPIGSTTAVTTTLYDTSAAGVTISNESQNINNIILFDPNNCATTTGANVQTLSAGGGSCTFYLEILNESNPVGVYPYSLTYNYTNGNQNFTANASINQRVYLYGGDYYSPGLYYVSTNLMSTGTSSESIVATWQNGLTGSPTTNNVNYIIEGSYGVVYFASGNSVYSSNGVTISQLGSNLSSTVTSLALDGAGNIYASTASNGMWVYNISATNPAWTQITDSLGNISASSSLIGLKGFEFATSPINTIYAFSSSDVYLCNVNGTATESCATALGAGKPNSFFTNAADVDNYGNLYTGSSYTTTLGISILNSNNTSWSTISNIEPTLYTNNSESAIGGVRFAGYNTLYFGAVSQPSIESSVYTCAIPNSCIPTLSSSLNPITGNAIAVTTDGVGNLYIGGSSLISNDYSASVQSTTAAFLLFGTYASSSSGVWQPITASSSGYPYKISSIAVASMLTSY